MVMAQRHHGTLPNKLTEIIVHPQTAQSTQNPYPFKPITSFASQEDSTSTSSQYTSTQHTYTQPISTQSARNQIGSAQAGASQISITPPSSAVRIPRNSSGQRVDPRVEALAWLVSAGRKRRLCYEYHLRDYCTPSPTPCPNAHGTEKLSVHQLNALQVLARELPCSMGNTCQDWACCFGHRCPFGERCNRGRSCRFARETHITDLKVVR